MLYIWFYSVNTQRKKEELLQLTQGKQCNQPIMTQESDPRRDRKMVST